MVVRIQTVSIDIRVVRIEWIPEAKPRIQTARLPLTVSLDITIFRPVNLIRIKADLGSIKWFPTTRRPFSWEMSKVVNVFMWPYTAANHFEFSVTRSITAVTGKWFVLRGLMAKV
jgi:hypothetical protein